MIFLILISTLFAQDVAVQGPTVSNIEYEKYLIKNPNQTPFVNYLVDQRNPKEAELLEDLKKAQFEFLKGSMEEAKKTFQKIVDQKHEEDWSKNVRKTIHYSHLRLAQLEKDENLKSKLLSDAFLFAPEIAVDQTLFPPPLQKQYADLFEKNSIQIWKLPKNSIKFSTLLVNGQKIENPSSFLRHRSGIVRISFLSNQWNPIHITTSLDKLESATLTLSPLVRGTCQFPRFSIPNHPSVRFRMVDKTCSSQPHSQLASNENLLPPPKSPSNSTIPKIFKSKWFWIGASVIATGFAINSANQNRNQGSSTASPASSSPKEFSN